jgi:hypothetical protein
VGWPSAGHRRARAAVEEVALGFWGSGFGGLGSSMTTGHGGRFGVVAGPGGGGGGWAERRVAAPPPAEVVEEGGWAKSVAGA